MSAGPQARPDAVPDVPADPRPPLTDEQRRLVESHMDWATSGARKYDHLWRHYIGYDDLRSAVWLGLCEAARRFDPSRGFAFKTYAFYYTQRWLTKALWREWRSDGWMLSYTGHQRNGMTRVQVRTPWPRMLTEDGQSLPWSPTGDPWPDVEAKIEVDQQRAAVLRVLDGRDRDIMRLRLEGKTFTQIGRAVGVSHQRARQLFHRTVRTARRRLAAAGAAA